ncbi:hypothetical protein FACUT_105 [Fusarium acutatum]|uniref:Uncharacterized protein n=1 Tax=Fusarium acutatum TaxID=78861 RepID=A0A8H4K9A8_9HYPO|nr:hypothetical protein FACUT_105 [Fusarium acutatum]
MASLLPLDSACPSFIVQPTDNRPQQTGALARLPVELMRMIAKSIDKPRTKDLRSLALSSAGLFNVIRPLYYRSGRFEDFRKALKTADVARMERNHEFGGLDVSIVWEKKYIKCRCRNKLAKHRKHRPIDVLLFRVIKGERASQVLLQEYTKRGVFLTDLELDTWTPPPALKDRYDAQEPFFHRRPHHEPWFIETDFALVTESLYADLMEPISGWEEEYQGQTADIWEAKMNLFLRYSAIDEHERALFQGTLEALRQIAKMSPGTDDAAGKQRWNAFRKAIRNFATAPELVSMYWDEDDWSESEFPENTRRPHRFFIDEDINPSFWSIGSAVVRVHK